MFSFDTQAQTFSPTNAMVLARIAHLAYQTGFDVEYDSKHTWNMEYAYIENTLSDTQFLVMGDSEKVFVAFRGTEGKLEDWTTNAKYHLVNALKGAVHEGFWQATQSIMGDLAQTLDRFCDKGQSLWLTGHSLGGALAMLATAYFVEQGIQPAGLYTFGQPRVGNNLFAYHFNEQYKRAYRVVCEGDVVSCVPPQHLGYEHAGAFYHLYQAGKYDQDLANWNAYWESDAKVVDEFAELALFGLKAHEIGTYQERLVNII
jgi:triacylglycerol lipase